MGIGGAVRGVAIALAATVMLSGCLTPSYVDRNKEDPNLAANVLNSVVFEVHPAYGKRPPACIAVLPFTADTDGDANEEVTAEQAEGVRRAMYAHLAPQGKRDIELSVIDSYLDGLPSDQQRDYRRIGADLDCDAIMLGSVMRYGSTFFGIYSRVAVGAEVRIIRAADGKVLWEGNHLAQSHGGTVPLTPIGAAIGIIEAATNVRSEQLDRVTDDLARRLVHTIPDNRVMMVAGHQTGGGWDDADLRYVASHGLNVRGGPGSDHPVTGWLKRFDRVEVVGGPSVDGWLPIKTKTGGLGYVSGQYLRREQVSSYDGQRQ